MSHFAQYFMPILDLLWMCTGALCSVQYAVILLSPLLYLFQALAGSIGGAVFPCCENNCAGNQLVHMGAYGYKSVAAWLCPIFPFYMGIIAVNGYHRCDELLLGNTFHFSCSSLNGSLEACKNP